MCENASASVSEYLETETENGMGKRRFEKFTLDL